MISFSHMVLLFILGIFNQSPASSIEIPLDHLTVPATQIPLNYFYPPGFDSVYLSRKPALFPGEPSDHVLSLIDRIESIPVEERIHVLNQFRSVTYRLHYPFLIASWYSRYLLSTFFIDVRLLRLLMRLATAERERRKHGEESLRTASDIIEHIRMKFPNSFEYITPQQVVDWYEILGGHTVTCKGSNQSRFKLLASVDPNIRAAIASRNDTLKVHVSITPAIWNKFFLQPRLERLMTTGYE